MLPLESVELCCVSHVVFYADTRPPLSTPCCSTVLPAVNNSLDLLGKLRDTARTAVADVEAVLHPDSAADLLDRGEAQRVLPVVQALASRIDEVQGRMNDIRTKVSWITGGWGVGVQLGGAGKWW